jgi:hypothetical protein
MTLRHQAVRSVTFALLGGLFGLATMIGCVALRPASASGAKAEIVGNARPGPTMRIFPDTSPKAPDVS